MELAANDWGTLINRRAVKEPIDKGGWSIFHTWLVGPDMANPAINYPMRGVGEQVLVRLADRRQDGGAAQRLVRRHRPGEQKKLIDDMQEHGWEAVPFIPTAQFVIPTAYRSNISGLLISPIAFLWNVEKK